MSTLEKILSAALAVLVIGIVYFSMHEMGEPHGLFGGERTEFEHSFGSTVRIGPFINPAGERSSGDQEPRCDMLQPVIVAALHDIKVDLQAQHVITEGPDSFEVDQQTLDLFCNKEATLTLADARGWTLVLTKRPFVRMAPVDAPQDIGTDVRIDAFVVPLGGAKPATPSATSDILIPDRYLEATSSVQ